MKEIKVTNKYELFKRLEGNRAIDDRRTERIKRSILKVGYITSPILVNENMEIIDGQGRFEALKQLQLPIEYIVQEGVGIKECVAMNVHQTNWKQIDYINSYADRGVQSYIYIRDLMQRFNINNTSVVAVATLGIGHFRTDHIRSGELEITQEEYEKAIKKLEFFKEILEGYSDITRILLFYKGLLYCAEIDGIDLNRLKEKAIETLETGKLPPMPTVEEVVQFIETIYNRNSKRPTLYIYTEYRKQVEERMAKSFRKLSEQRRLYKYLANAENTKQIVEDAIEQLNIDSTSKQETALF